MRTKACKFSRISNYWNEPNRKRSSIGAGLKCARLRIYVHSIIWMYIIWKYLWIAWVHVRVLYSNSPMVSNGFLTQLERLLLYTQRLNGTKLYEISSWHNFIIQLSSCKLWTTNNSLQLFTIVFQFKVLSISFNSIHYRMCTSIKWNCSWNSTFLLFCLFIKHLQFIYEGQHPNIGRCVCTCVWWLKLIKIYTQIPGHGMCSSWVWDMMCMSGFHIG